MENYEKPLNGAKRRILFITDYHYCPEEQAVFYRSDKDERMQSMIANINAEHAKDPFDAIISTGDSALDFWVCCIQGEWINNKRSFTKKFLDTYRSQMPAGVPMYFAPGNHEQFSDIQFKMITGNSRNHYFVMDNFLFIVWDAFGANLNPTQHSDGTYTSINVEWARQVMDAHPDKYVIFCSHWMQEDPNVEGLEELVKDDRVIAFFVGHDHQSMITYVYGKPVIHDGHYSYSGCKDPADCMWGFRELYIGEDSIFSRYIVPDNTCTPRRDQPLTVEYHYQDEIEISLKK